MEIVIKERAEKLLAEKLKGGGRLKLFYDTEGCGCGVDGVPTLWIVQEQRGDEVEIKTNAMPVLVEKAKQIFYDDRMTIDVAGPGLYRLSSPNEILNGRMVLKIKGQV